MIPIRTTGAVVVIVLALASPSSAQDIPGTAPPHPCTASLVSPVTSIVPGQPFEIGVHWRIDKGWHLYWHSPRDGGDGPTVQWSLPAGFKVTPLEWPVPHRYVEYDTIVIYGYSDELLLKCRVQPPADWKGPVSIGAKVDWQVCKDVCYYGKASLDLELKTSHRREPSKARAEFDRWKKRYPSLVIPPGVSVEQEFQRDGADAEWTVRWTAREWKDRLPSKVFPYDLEEGAISEAKFRVVPGTNPPAHEATFQLESLSANFRRGQLGVLIVYGHPGAHGPTRAFIVRGRDAKTP